MIELDKYCKSDMLRIYYATDPDATEITSLNPPDSPHNEGFINPNFTEENKMQKCQEDACHKRRSWGSNPGRLTPEPPLGV